MRSSTIHKWIIVTLPCILPLMCFAPVSWTYFSNRLHTPRYDVSFVPFCKLYIHCFKKRRHRFLRWRGDSVTFELFFVYFPGILEMARLVFVWKINFIITFLNQEVCYHPALHLWPREIRVEVSVILYSKRVWFVYISLIVLPSGLGQIKLNWKVCIIHWCYLSSLSFLS